MPKTKKPSVTKMASMYYELGVMMYNLVHPQAETLEINNEYNPIGGFKKLLSGLEKQLGYAISIEWLRDGFLSETQNYGIKFKNGDPLFNESMNLLSYSATEEVSLYEAIGELAFQLLSDDEAALAILNDYDVDGNFAYLLMSFEKHFKNKTDFTLMQQGFLYETESYDIEEDEALSLFEDVRERIELAMS